MQLSDHDKQIIQTINEQVNILIRKGASDSVLIDTLIDFVPDIKCIINAVEDKNLQLFTQEYQSFNHFVSLLGNAPGFFYTPPDLESCTDL